MNKYIEKIVSESKSMNIEFSASPTDRAVAEG